MPGKFDKKDPNAFRLVRVGLNGGGAATIPLRYVHITWDDINAWLAKNAPESAKASSP